MARTRTLEEMETDARRIADEEDTIDRFPQAEVWRYLNQGIAELWDLLIESRGYGYWGRPYLEMGSVTKSDPASATVSISGQPLSEYQVVLTVTTADTTYSYSLNGGASEAETGKTLGVSYEPPGTGLLFQFAPGSYPEDVTYSASAQCALQTYSGQLTYALPDDFYKVHSVQLITSGTSLSANATRIELQPLDPRTEAQLRDGSLVNQGLPYFFEISQAGLSLYPVPQGEYGIYLKYVPTAPVLTDEDETFDGINGWEEYACVWAAYRMKLKNDEQPMVQALVSDLNRLRERIKNTGHTRNAGQPDRVKDVRASRRWALIRGQYR